MTDHVGGFPPYTYVPVGVPISVDNIISLLGVSSLFSADFQANILPLATCVSSSTQQCIGPFQLDQQGLNVAVVMNIYGTLINLTDGTKSAFDIAVTGQYLGTTIAAVITAAESPTGAFSNSWSGSVIAAIPEPGTSAMMLLAGGMLLALSRIRRQRKP